GERLHAGLGADRVALARVVEVGQVEDREPVVLTGRVGVAAVTGRRAGERVRAGGAGCGGADVRRGRAGHGDQAQLAAPRGGAPGGGPVGGGGLGVPGGVARVYGAARSGPAATISSPPPAVACSMSLGAAWGGSTPISTNRSVPEAVRRSPQFIASFSKWRSG